MSKFKVGDTVRYIDIQDGYKYYQKKGFVGVITSISSCSTKYIRFDGKSTGSNQSDYKLVPKVISTDIKVGDIVEITKNVSLRCTKGCKGTVIEVDEYRIKLEMDKGFISAWISLEACLKILPKYPNPPHKHAELIKAWADGAEIEYQTQGKWRVTLKPSWHLHTVYRIKPTEPSLNKIQELEAKARELADEIAKLKE